MTEEVKTVVIEPAKKSTLVDRLPAMTLEQLLALPDVEGLSDEESRALELRLDELRAARENDRDAARKKKLAAAALRREAFNAQELPKIEAEHGDIGVDFIVEEYNGGFIALKRPHAATFKRFSDSKRLNYDVCDRFIRPCVIYPEKSKLDAIFDRAPGLVIQCANKLMDLARARKAEEGKG